MVDKDELHAGNGTYRIRALTTGYARDVFRSSSFTGGIGANATLYGVPTGLKPFDGARWRSFYAFMSVRMQ